MTQSQRTFVRWLLTVLTVAAGARLLGFAVIFAERDLQTDFSVYYTAGQALNAGLSPYVNNVSAEPPIWDGEAEYRHSRFLYPPLCAVPFRLLAMLPFATAKAIWTLACLVAVALATGIAARALLKDWGNTALPRPLRREPVCGGHGAKTTALPRPLRGHSSRTGRGEANGHLQAVAYLVVALGACLFHPLLVYLDAGQIDAFTLLLLVAAIFLLLGPQPRHWAVAGLLLAFACVLKLHCVYLLPFVLLRRKWTAAVGFAAGVVVVVAATLGSVGWEQAAGYVRRDLPRIARFGEGGTPDMRLSPEAIAALGAGAPPGGTVKDGRPYQRSSFDAEPNATLIRPLTRALARCGIRMQQTVLSVIVFACFFLIVCGLEVFARPARWMDATQEFAWWLAAVAIVLLASPMTWVMNVIWLIPALPLAVQWACSLRHPWEGRVLAALVIGLLLAAVPDGASCPLLVPYAGRFLHLKYVAAEILVAASLLVLAVGRAAARES